MVSLFLVVFYVFSFFLLKAFRKPTEYTFICIISLLYFGFGTVVYEFKNGITSVVIAVHCFLFSLTMFMYLQWILKRSFSGLHNSPKVKISAINTHVILVLVLTSSCLLFYQLLFLNPFIQGGGLEEARVKIVFENKLFFYNLLLLSPVLLLLSYVCNLKIKRFFLALIILTSLSTGFRSILINVLAIFIFYHFLCNNLSFTQYLKKIIFLTLLIILFLIIITALRTDDISSETLILAINILVDRVFILNLRNIENIINYHFFYDHLYGYAFYSDITTFFNRLFSPLGAVRLETYAEFITKKLNPTGNDMFIMTPTIVGVSYADFGLYGIFLSAFFIFILALLIAPLKNTNLGLPFYCYFCYVLGVMATRGIPATIALYIIPIIMLYFILKVINIYTLTSRLQEGF